MTLTELDSASSVNTFKSSNANSLVCFSATWCGPCKASKPQLVNLASTYAQDPAVDVRFGIVYEHTLSEGIHEFGIRAFPTYVLYTNHGMKMAGKIEGVNFEGIKQLIAANGCKKDLGVGHSLGGSGGGASENLSLADARAQRLAMFEKKKPAAQDTTTDASANENNDVDKKQDSDLQDVNMDENTQETVKETATSASTPMETETQPAQKEDDVEMKDATSTKEEEKTDENMIDPTANLSKEFLDTLTGEMGFTLLRAQKGLINGNGSVEGAVEWLMNHQDDEDIDEPIKLVHKPLTAEEKAAKVLELKALMKEKRDQRDALEKVDHVEREKQRRSMGQQMAKTREEMEHQARLREAKQRKKEKDAFKRERARLKAELEKDKAERRAHKGKLTSKLGIDGYNPDAIQYDVDGDDEHKPAETGAKKKPKASVAKIDEYISKVSAYRAGGDGGKCLKILLAYIKNVVDKPDEDKFKHINMENKAFKGKIKPFIGAKSLLLAVGFSPNQTGTGLDLAEDADRDVLAETKAKLEAALAAY